MQETLVGRSVSRKEGRDKVTGKACYVDDMVLPGMIFGATVRSSIPRGRIRKISFAPEISWDEFTIVKAVDIPGKNVVALIANDQPYLAVDVVNHAEEPILLIAHPDKYMLDEARRGISIDIDPLPPVFTVEDSLARKEVIWGSDNIFKSYLVEKGNVDEQWRSAAVVVEGNYSTGSQEQLYIETNGMIAAADSQRGVTVWGSMQCPYYVHRALMALFDLPEDKIRVVQLETGGGFGGKEEYPSMIAGHAALLAWKSGKPVKIIYDRFEDMVATTKRHPSVTHHRTAVNAEGKLLAMEVDFTLDGGAYATLSSVVLSRGTIHAVGPYFCPNVRIRSRAVATSFPPHGAFRGFGAPQSIFALERHMNKVAQTLNLSPEEFRRRNFIQPGQTTATGQVIRESVDLERLMNRAFEMSDYHRKQKEFSRQSAKAKVRRGIGFASFMHGAGFTGSGERHLKSVVAVEATAAGDIRILTSSIEMGQGTKTVLAQIAAQALRLPCEAVELHQVDTGVVPDSGPTVASRTCMIVGKLVETAAVALRQKLTAAGLLTDGYSSEDFRSACRSYVENFGPLKSVSRFEPRADVYWDDDKYAGDAYGTYSWAVYVAEVSVDMVTLEIRVEDFVAVQEVGKVINPVLAAGQIEGGVAQGIGFALYENIEWKDGRMLNSQMTNYIIPTAPDTPSIRVYFEEVPYRDGPFGAKGLGELPIDGPAPAVVNAVENATGVSIDRIPLTPESLMEALGR